MGRTGRFRDEWDVFGTNADDTDFIGMSCMHESFRIDRNGLGMGRCILVENGRWMMENALHAEVRSNVREEDGGYFRP
mgnify:CR=1 FL=1